MKRRELRFLRAGAIALPALVLVLIGLFAISNLTLPTQLVSTGRLSDLEKARLAELRHLQQAAGDDVWPGWGQLDIPIIVYDAEYAFLVGYPDPPPGWLKMPHREPRGGPWEVVPDDTFEGRSYYRQLLADPNLTPENFTVLVGERWAATMETKEYMEVAFYAGFRKDLPAFLRPIVPYRLMWGLLMAETDSYIAGLAHEAFHAYQGTRVPTRLAAAEIANRAERRYPWNDANLRAGWEQELDQLAAAVRASTEPDGAVTDLARQFLAARDQRRAAAGLDRDLVDYERQREWLEGLAKYAEVSIGLAATGRPDYTPLPALDADPAFKSYANRERYRAGQVGEITRAASRESESRFYTSGMAQAMLLDHLLPGWKTRAFDDGVMLEDLLREAAGPTGRS